MADRNIIDILLRARGGKQVAGEGATAAGGIRKVERAQNATVLSSARMRGGLAGIGRAAITARGAGAAFAVYMAGKGAAAGLRFNATMEQNEVAFTNFLGSTRAARTYLSDLYEVAAKTPFEFPELTEASVKLMGFGMSARDTRKWMVTLGDAIAGVGGGSEEIQRATLALGQMQAKGKVSMEELNQLTEARIPAIKILQKELGLTRDQMANIGAEGISAKKALPALRRGLADMFGGQAAKQAATYSGQMSTLRDNFKQLLGRGMRPAFGFLRATALPALNRIIAGKFPGWVNRSKTALVGWFNEARRGQGALAKVGQSARNLAIVARWAFQNVLWPVAKRVFPGLRQLVQGLIRQLGGLINLVTGVLTGDWRRAWRGLTGILRGAVKAWGGIIRAATAPFRHAAERLGGAIVDGVVSVIKSAPGKVRDAILGLIPSRIRGPLETALGFGGGAAGRAVGFGKKLIPGLAQGGIVAGAGRAIVGERGPELLSLPRAARVDPLPAPRLAMAGVGPIEVHTKVFLNDREIAEAFAKHIVRRRART